MPTFSQSNFSHELEIAGRLAEEAGKLILRYRDGGDLRVQLKAGDEPVTIADQRSSEFIVHGLREAFPDDIIISEENADDSRRRTAKRVWFIDPIDGTKDFIRGEDGFCVMIGLAIDQRPHVGVVYAPATGRLYSGEPAIGTWETEPGRPEVEPKRVSVSTNSDVSAIRLVASKSHRNQTIDRVKSALGIADEQNVGSIGLKLALIALGARDLYVNPTSRCSGWDTCAPEALLHAAGGKMSDIYGDPLRYDLEGTDHPRGLLASNGHLHAHAVSKIAPLFPDGEGFQ